MMENMEKIIEINTNSPFLRPNFRYIADLMRQGGVVTHVDSRQDALSLGRNIARNRESFGMVKISKKKWKVFIKDATEVKKKASKYYMEKLQLLDENQTVSLVNKGQCTYLMGLFRRFNPADDRGFKWVQGDDGLELWLTNSRKN